MRIENIVLKQLVNNEDYTRKVIPFLNKEYFADTNEQIVFEKIKELYQRWPPIETHPNRQFPGSPMTGYTVCKYMSPWIIETPKDYSMLFCP